MTVVMKLHSLHATLSNYGNANGMEFNLYIFNHRIEIGRLALHPKQSQYQTIRMEEAGGDLISIYNEAEATSVPDVYVVISVFLSMLW